MEIGNNPANHSYPVPVNRKRVQPAVAASGRGTRLSVANGKDQTVEYISRGDVVRGQRVNRSRTHRQVRAVQSTLPCHDGISFQGLRALDAYHGNGAQINNGGVEVMPRIDNYV